MRRPAAEIGAGAEAAARPGHDDRADGVVGVGAVEGVDHLLEHRPGERVEVIGAVHREGQRRTVDLVADLLVRHGFPFLVAVCAWTPAASGRARALERGQARHRVGEAQRLDLALERGEEGVVVVAAQRVADPAGESVHLGAAEAPGGRGRRAQADAARPQRRIGIVRDDLLVGRDRRPGRACARRRAPSMPKLFTVSSTIMWLSVPPVTSVAPRSRSPCASALALASTSRQWTRKSVLQRLLERHRDAGDGVHVRAALEPGNTALSMVFACCSRHSTMPPRGPRSVLCVVVVTMSKP